MICARLYGGSIFNCRCLLPDGAGFLECPPEARGILVAVAEAPPPVVAEAPSAAPRNMAGEFCQDCGSPNMIRTGTCLTCANCGSSSGGCS